MARIRPPRRRNPLLRLLDLGARRAYGRRFAPLELVAWNPRFLLPYTGMAVFAHGKTRLAPEIRTLATLLVAERNECAWCIDFGRWNGSRDGVSGEKLAALARWSESPVFSAAESAALAFAEEAAAGAHVSDETFARAREHFDDRELVELTAAVAAEGFWNTVNSALGIEAQGFCGAAPAPAGRAPA